MQRQAKATCCGLGSHHNVHNVGSRCVREGGRERGGAIEVPHPAQQPIRAVNDELPLPITPIHVVKSVSIFLLTDSSIARVANTSSASSTAATICIRPPTVPTMDTYTTSRRKKNTTGDGEQQRQHFIDLVVQYCAGFDDKLRVDCLRQTRRLAVKRCSHLLG